MTDNLFNRRRLLAGLSGMAVIGGTSNFGARAQSRDVDGGRATKHVEPVTRSSFGPTQTLVLSALNFKPISNADYAYQSPGGVTMNTGGGDFGCPINLPVGTRLTSVRIYVNPNGAPISFEVRRYRLVSGAGWEDLGNATSTSGTTMEGVNCTCPYTFVSGWDVFIQNLLIGAGQVIYGMQVSYRNPV